MEDLLILIAEKHLKLSEIIRGHSLAYWHLKKAKDDGFQQVAMCVYDLSVINAPEVHSLVDASFRPLILAADTLSQQLARVQMNYGEHRSCIIANMGNYLTIPYEHDVANTLVFSDRSFSRTPDDFICRSVDDFAEIYSPKEALLDDKHMWMRLMTSTNYLYNQIRDVINVFDEPEKFAAKVVTSRVFNSINIDVSRGLVHKSSSKKEKLLAESKWYTSLPADLRGFVPSKIAYLEGTNEDMLTMEYCPFPTLSELYVSEDPSINWNSIVDRLLEVHSMFVDAYEDHEGYHDKDIEEDCKVFYIEKTKDRYKKLESDPMFSSLLHIPELEINNEMYCNIDIDTLCTMMHKYQPADTCSFVHGDYCLSNILMDLKSKVIKLIDPRGILGNCMCPLGDPYYDLAKLDHSIYGLYDYIVSGKYSVSSDRNHYELKIKTAHDTERLSDKIIGHEYKYVRTLETSLFLSMIPLHYEDSDRQLAFYLRAVQLYNKLL